MYLSTGNKKIKSDINNKFLIWSLPSDETCINSTALCRKHCYAKQSESQYPSVLPCRKRNLQASKQRDFVTLMTYEISKYINKPSWKNKEVYFRKWLEIVSKFPNIHFTAYTKSYKLIPNKYPCNLQLIASIWCDTKQSDLRRIHAMGLRTFESLPEKYFELTNSFKCVGNCVACKACYIKPTVDNRYHKIQVKIH